MSFFVATPFPPSLQFLLLSVGVLLILLPTFERLPLRVTVFAAAGRAPVLSSIGLVSVIHALAVAVTLAGGGDASYLFVSQPFMERPPDGAGFGLPLVIACGIAGLLLVSGACALYARAAGGRHATTPAMAHRRWWTA